MTYFWAISLEDDFLLGLSAPKKTFVWVISVEDHLFLGYQHRILFIFRLSVSKMTYFGVSSVNGTFIKGLTHVPIKSIVTRGYRVVRSLRPGETGVVGERRRRVNPTSPLG